jgi:predicted methyltransferase
MKIRTYVLGLAAVLALTNCATTPKSTPDELIEGAIANPARSDADRERDLRSHPDVILGLLNIQPGDTVADVLGGGGYYSELIAGVTGSDGEVILHNNTPYSKFVMKQLQEKYIDQTVPGIRVQFSEVDNLEFSPDSLDAALMVMSFHDLYYVNPERGWLHTDVELFLRQLYAAMRPGGRLVIVDHAAFDGTGGTAPQEVHRIDKEFARQEIEQAGFVYMTESDVLRNPEDDKSKMVFDKSVRGKTDRFAMVFSRD